MFTHEPNVHVACNFSCLIQTENRRNESKVAGIHVHCTCGNVSKVVQGRDVTTEH